MDERFRHAERWHGALRDWPGQLHLAWGMLDPVASINVLEAVRGLRPQAPLAELPEIGHYPQIEDPVRLNSALQRALDA
jgi:pimeloyl-ACP methyl ester carboxylesterase